MLQGFAGPPRIIIIVIINTPMCIYFVYKHTQLNNYMCVIIIIIIIIIIIHYYSLLFIIIHYYYYYYYHYSLYMFNGAPPGQAETVPQRVAPPPPRSPRPPALALKGFSTGFHRVSPVSLSMRVIGLRRFSAVFTSSPPPRQGPLEQEK